MKEKNGKWVHMGFGLGLLLKGADGLLEVAGGFLLLFLSPERLSRLTRLLTQHELSEDPRDLVANFLLSFSAAFSVSAQHFGVLYLASHGLVKCLLVVLLWRKKLWAYPLTIASLVAFIAYQVYRYALSPSGLLAALTVLDLFMIVLTYLEYQRIAADFGK